jgi:hypothetical protein
MMTISILIETHNKRRSFLEDIQIINVSSVATNGDLEVVSLLNIDMNRVTDLKAVKIFNAVFFTNLLQRPRIFGFGT